MKTNKYYKQAYNNPGQFNIENFKDIEVNDIQKNIVNGVTDALKDRENGTYKYI